MNRQDFEDLYGGTFALHERSWTDSDRYINN